MYGWRKLSFNGEWSRKLLRSLYLRSRILPCRILCSIFGQDFVAFWVIYDIIYL